ncbi:class I SAM-dependent methyltransferase [Pseudarthrobacter sp. NPDC058362]|uniref:class I SAM-dependent methyltransferase n=1 Tax=unclassified Pseudarthrobacter TaxID=2647000 RepID=UPI0036619374
MPLLMRRRAAAAEELMDRPDCDPARLENTYRQFGVVNRVVSGWRRLYVREVRPLLAPTGTATLLDVGSGGGDLAVTLRRWARSDAFDLRITGIDPDPRAIAFAVQRPPVSGVEFRQAHSSDLVAEGRRYDLVVSNHVLHHLSPAQLHQLLEDTETLATRLCLHNDLRRSPAAYALFSVAALPFRHSFIRADGLTSIRRSYTPAELTAAAPPGWAVARTAAFHHALVRRA